MKKVSVIGHFAKGYTYLDGQTVKTKIVAEQLVKSFGADQVGVFDTHGGMKTLIKSPFFVWKAFRDSQNVIILPAHRGLRVFGRLLPMFRRFFKDRKIHYVVIGGWLAPKLQKEKGLKKALKKFDGIYVETNTMKNALAQMGFANVFIMPNCKALTALQETDLVYCHEKPYKLCTFSRVNKEKGIETAVDIIRRVNDKLGCTAFALDIYGQVDPMQRQWFEQLKEKFTPCIRYCGCVPADKSVETLKDYFALLFPTHYPTEGIPGTIIDAYAAGVPVISAKWQSFADVVDDGITGLGYTFDSDEALENVLMEIYHKRELIDQMKLNCLLKSKEYLPCNALKIVIANMV